MPFRKLYWCVVACLLFGSCCIAEAGNKAKEYVDATNGFRVTVPAGWKKAETKNAELLAAFESEDKPISFNVFHGPLDGVSPEEYLQNMMALQMTSDKISEEQTLLSGLPATKFVYTWSPRPSARSRDVEIYVISDKAYWHLAAGGPDGLLDSHDSQGLLDVETFFQSFQFLEPILSVLKANVWQPSSRIETRTVDGSRRRYFASDRLAMSILLPEGWERGAERASSYSQGARVVLQRPATLAQVILVREILDAPPDLYLKLEEKVVNQNLVDVRKISEETVTFNRLEGVKRVRVGKNDEIKIRLWTLIVSNGNKHFQITAVAPDEVFEKYAAEFKEMMDSIQFLGEK